MRSTGFGLFTLVQPIWLWAESRDCESTHQGSPLGLGEHRWVHRYSTNSRQAATHRNKPRANEHVHIRSTFWSDKPSTSLILWTTCGKALLTNRLGRDTGHSNEGTLGKPLAANTCSCECPNPRREIFGDPRMSRDMLRSSPGFNKPHHDRCKPRSHGGSEKGAVGVRPLLGRPMAMYTLVTLAARAGIDLVRTGSQDSGTRRRRTEKSGSRRDHQDQAGSTGLKTTRRGSSRAAGHREGMKHEVAKGHRPGSRAPSLGRRFRAAAECGTGMVAT